VHDEEIQAAEGRGLRLAHERRHLADDVVLVALLVGQTRLEDTGLRQHPDNLASHLLRRLPGQMMPITSP